MAYYPSLRLRASASIPNHPPLFRIHTNSPEAYVFLSFRGDTRSNFTSHLHTALSRLGVRTFIDSEMKIGDDISQLFEAIEGSKVSVVVFSPNYASSTWCLDELVKIIECRTRGQIVVPIFYHIQPTHVRHQSGPYADAFAVHHRRRRFMASERRRLLRWRLALTEAANIFGWDCSLFRTESELVEKIAIDVLQKLDSMNDGEFESRIATYKQMALMNFGCRLIILFGLIVVSYVCSSY